MQVIIENRQKIKEWTPELEELVKRVIEEIAGREGLAPDAEVGVTIVDNEEIKGINSAYRGIDRPTDVISFALNDEEEEEPEADEQAQTILQKLLGDIVISLEQAGLQAVDYGHSLERELAFLTAHGMLHLLGYDHEREEDEREMMEITESVLRGLGWGR